MTDAKKSIEVGLATGALVFAIYMSTMPSLADTRSNQPNNKFVESSRKVATWTSAGLVSLVFLLSGDPTVLLVGGAMVVAEDFSHRIANATSPATNKVITPASE
jgi:hypothetical protein